MEDVYQEAGRSDAVIAAKRVKKGKVTEKGEERVNVDTGETKRVLLVEERKKEDDDGRLLS